MEVTRKCIERVSQVDDCRMSQRGVVALDEGTARALEMLTRPRESASRKRYFSFTEIPKRRSASVTCIEYARVTSDVTCSICRRELRNLEEDGAM